MDPDYTNGTSIRTINSSSKYNMLKKNLNAKFARFHFFFGKHSIPHVRSEGESSKISQKKKLFTHFKIIWFVLWLFPVHGRIIFVIWNFTLICWSGWICRIEIGRRWKLKRQLFTVRRWIIHSNHIGYRVYWFRIITRLRVHRISRHDRIRYTGFVFFHS